jgi:hypothetical protein
MNEQRFADPKASARTSERVAWVSGYAAALEDVRRQGDDATGRRIVRVWLTQPTATARLAWKARLNP